MERQARLPAMVHLLGSPCRRKSQYLPRLCVACGIHRSDGSVVPTASSHGPQHHTTLIIFLSQVFGFFVGTKASGCSELVSRHLRGSLRHQRMPVCLVHPRVFSRRRFWSRCYERRETRTSRLHLWNTIRSIGPEQTVSGEDV